MWMINKGNTNKPNKQIGQKREWKIYRLTYLWWNVVYRYKCRFMKQQKTQTPVEDERGDDAEEKNCDVTQQIRSRFFHLHWLRPFQSGEFLFFPSFPMKQTLFCFPRCRAKNKSHFKLLFHIFVRQIAISFWWMGKTKQQQQIAIWTRITSKCAMWCCCPFPRSSL